MELIPLDAIATVFIFLIGLPAILLQTLPPEIRKIVVQERKQEVVAFTVGPIVTATFLVSAGVYLSAPEPGMSLDAAKARAELIWLGGIALLISIAGSSALLFIQRWSRSSVIKRLQHSAARPIAVQGRPAEHILASLIDLGVQSPAGRDKNLVLDALERLTRATQDNPSYNGAQLEKVIEGLEEIFTASPHFGTAENFRKSADLLVSLVMASGEREQSEDMQMAVQAASLLGRASLRHEQSDIQIRFLQAIADAGDNDNIGLTTWASQAILELGADALARKSTLVAMTALSKMETLVMRHSPVGGELASDFIGLLAHFWARNETGREYAKQFLERAHKLLADPLPEVIANARAWCLQHARFTTGDYLARMHASPEVKARSAPPEHPHDNADTSGDSGTEASGSADSAPTPADGD